MTATIDALSFSQTELQSSKNLLE